jgi:glycosyltransferase involved in cell wall biosynthesis
MNRFSKIKVIFDAGPIVNGNKTGVGRATEGLILALAANYPNDLELVGHYFDFMGRKKETKLPTASNIRYRRTVLVPGKVFNMLRRLGLPVPFEMLAKERGGFHLFPGFIGWPSLFGTPSAPFVHDITYIDFPEYVNGPARFDLKTIMPRTIKRASFIITNSESSKSGLMREYGLKDKAVLVEHIPGVSITKIGVKEADNRIEKMGIKQPYLLFFGTLEPRKNITNLMLAYEKLNAGIRDKYSLVIGGGKGWHDEEILKTMKQLKNNGLNIKQTGYVSDEDRAALYMKATLYLMPSHYEGFGMQLLEGMAYKVPMLVSDIPVLHEVAGSSAAYCQTSSDDIAVNITNLIKNSKFRERLVDAGAKRLKDFSWHSVAKDIFAQIKKVATK